MINKKIEVQGHHITFFPDGKSQQAAHRTYRRDHRIWDYGTCRHQDSDHRDAAKVHGELFFDGSKWFYAAIQGAEFPDGSWKCQNSKTEKR